MDLLGTTTTYDLELRDIEDFFAGNRDFDDLNSFKEIAEQINCKVSHLRQLVWRMATIKGNKNKSENYINRPMIFFFLQLKASKLTSIWQAIEALVMNRQTILSWT